MCNSVAVTSKKDILTCVIVREAEKLRNYIWSVHCIIAFSFVNILTFLHLTGGTKETENLEIGFDRRTLRGQNHGSGQNLNLLWKLGMESLQVYHLKAASHNLILNLFQSSRNSHSSVGRRCELCRVVRESSDWVSGMSPFHKPAQSFGILLNMTQNHSNKLFLPEDTKYRAEAEFYFLGKSSADNDSNWELLLCSGRG